MVVMLCARLWSFTGLWGLGSAAVGCTMQTVANLQVLSLCANLIPPRGPVRALCCLELSELCSVMRLAIVGWGWDPPQAWGCEAPPGQVAAACGYCRARLGCGVCPKPELGQRKERNAQPNLLPSIWGKKKHVGEEP